MAENEVAGVRVMGLRTSALLCCMGEYEWPSCAGRASVEYVVNPVTPCLLPGGCFSPEGTLEAASQ